MTKAPTPTEMSKGQDDNTINAIKSSITERLRTDFGLLVQTISRQFNPRVFANDILKKKQILLKRKIHMSSNLFLRTITPITYPVFPVRRPKPRLVLGITAIERLLATEPSLEYLWNTKRSAYMRHRFTIYSIS